MTDSVNAIGGAASTSSSKSVSSSSSSSDALTYATKAKLEAMGINTDNITTEAQGQAALQAAMEKQAAQQMAQKPQTGETEDVIKTDAKSLAATLGVSVSNTDTTDDILSKISEQIDQLRAEAGSDEAKLAEAENYQAQYDELSNEYSSMQASQSQLTNSMSGMASYNKIYQNLE